MCEIKIVGCMDNTIDHTFESANRVYSVDGLSPTIPTCSGGGIQPKIMEIIKLDSHPLRMVRTEEGKRLRKDYETGKIHHGFNEYRKLEVKREYVCNTITSVQKDNLIMERYKIKQATQKGYAECCIGGGSRLDLPEKQYQKRPGNRRRESKSHYNDGEYP